MSVPTLIMRPLRRARGLWRDQRARAQIAIARAQRAARLRAVKAGLARPEVAIVECRHGADVSGLFSEVAAVIGFLDHFDRCRDLYGGLRVEFNDGLYFDAAAGPNWWSYYFEPIAIGGGAPERAVDPHFHDHCAYRVERSLPRERGAWLVNRYIVVQRAVRQVVDAFVARHWDGSPVIGVHYRGTDKAEDAPRMTYEQVAAAVRRVAERRDRFRVFLATDEAAHVDFMRREFGDRLLCRDIFRSTDGRPIDVVNADGNHQKGLDAVVDCLLLARTHALVRTASNLSLCSTLFNPQLPDLLLNPER